LLPLLGLPFVIKTVAVDERQLDGEAPTELVLRIGRAKAVAVNEVRADELVVAADTVVVLHGEVLGKPTGPEDAARMLRLLRGGPHIVYTGVCVWHAARRRMASELAESQVWMRDYTDAEIASYVESGDPLDKAGAYAIQHADFGPVAKVEGCYLTVVGLPLCHLQGALARFGVVVPSTVPAACHAFNQCTCTALGGYLG
jgi:MAF protein